nr:hypothetical protein [Tanacetum cinerariifolium]
MLQLSQDGSFCKRVQGSPKPGQRKKRQLQTGQAPKALMAIDEDLDNLIESQRSKKNKEGLGYTDVPPHTAQLYLSPKKDLSWTGLPECADDTV